MRISIVACLSLLLGFASGWFLKPSPTTPALPGANATAATVGGRKVISYRPRQGWSTKDLMRDYGDLTQQYMTYEMVARLDVYQFAAHHPEIAAKYQTRDFKEVASE